MTTLGILLVFAIIGLAMFFGSKTNPKVAETGKLIFFCAFLVLLMVWAAVGPTFNIVHR